MIKGEIVLIPFPFTDLSGNKNRPALVLIASHDDVTVCFITSQLKWPSEFDVLINPSLYNGIKVDSLIRLNKFATIDKDLVLGKLGNVDSNLMFQINQNLRKILQLE